MEASGTGEEYNVDILVNTQRNDNNSRVMTLLVVVKSVRYLLALIRWWSGLLYFSIGGWVLDQKPAIIYGTPC